MNVLVVCDKGVNRSVTLASMLKFRGHDALPVGIDTSDPETINMLCDWAQRIILTDGHQRLGIPRRWHPLITLWSVGPDTYPRPFNKALMRKFQSLIDTRSADLS